METKIENYEQVLQGSDQRLEIQKVDAMNGKRKVQFLFILGLLLLCVCNGCTSTDQTVGQTPTTSQDGNVSTPANSPNIATTPSTASNRAAYGVFIGVNPEDAKILHDYETVVIDAEYYSAEEIQELKQRGIKIYSYLNIGSIETFRDSYSEHKNGTLGEYDNWPDEYWMDVSLPTWQDYIQEAAQALVSKGVDGFFLDNTDVYYEYHTPKIFQGLIAIINDLEHLQKDIFINGGDTFVTEAILEPDTPLVRITGVNQECVFTSIDFDNDKLVTQTSEDTKYFQDYLQQCDDAELMVYLTEYFNNGDSTLPKKIEDYCEKYGFIFYISSSVELDGR